MAKRSTMVMTSRMLLAGVVMALAGSCAHQGGAVGPAHPRPTTAATQPVDLKGVHNVVAFSEKLYSGSVPEGQAGLMALRAMGIRTIISVDGMQPDVAGARALGMRYVHLPIGYDGMDATRTLELSRAVRDLPGPIYLHCHHGKHRSAAASAAVSVTLGEMTPQEGIARMKVAGTSPAYRGLFKCVEVASPASGEALARVDASFPSAYKTGSMVQAMVEIDEIFEDLKSVEKSGWKVPSDHPDLVPVARAGRLADVYRELTQDKSPVCRSEDFQKMLTTSAQDAAELEALLASSTRDTKALSAKFKTVAQSCTACHVSHRN